jgi:hypothetical protein
MTYECDSGNGVPMMKNKVIRCCFCIEMLFVVVILGMGFIKAERKNITIGVIVEDNLVTPFGIYRSKAAIEMGIEKLREIVSEEADMTTRLALIKEECVQDMVGAFAAEMYYVDKVSAFFGPGKCDEQV